MLDIPIEDLISLIVVIIAVIINLIVGIKSYKSYRQNPLIQTLIFGTAAFLIAFSMLFLVTEKLFLSAMIQNGDLGMLFGLIAITCSAGALTFLDIFAFNMVFPNKYKLLTLGSAIIAAIYLVFWYADPSRAIGWGPDGSGEIVLSDLTTWISYFTLAPLLLIPVGVFYYYALKVRKKSPISSKRSVTLGSGILVLTVGYIIEIAGLDPSILPIAPIINIIGRTLFIFGALLLYWGLFRIKAKT